MADPAETTEEWRRRYLAVMDIQLALVVYTTSPNATIGGVRAILTRRESGVA